MLRPNFLGDRLSPLNSIISCEGFDRCVSIVGLDNGELGKMDWWNEDFGRLLRVKVERCHSGISEVTSTHLHCLIDNFRCLK